MDPGQLDMSSVQAAQDLSPLCEAPGITIMEESIPDALVPLLHQLEEAVQLEGKFVSNLYLPSTGADAKDITQGIRDGCAHVLRCLKVWYDLPSDVLFVSINFMDRFLAKMKVQAKHMACISVSSFSLAAQQVALHGFCPEPDLKDLALISQSKCTPGDLERMEGIIEHKLETTRSATCGLPITSLTFLQLYNNLFHSTEMGVLFQKTLAAGAQGADIWQRLEIIICDSKCAAFRPSVIALVLLYTQLQAGVEALGAPDDPALCAQLVQLITFAVYLQKVSQISAISFSTCLECVSDVLSKYNAQSQIPHRQRLVWKLSHRTRRLLRPIDRFSVQLPTIEEHGLFTISESRPRSGSVSSEESSESEREEGNGGTGFNNAARRVQEPHWFKLPY